MSDYELQRLQTFVGADGIQLRFQACDEEGNPIDLTGSTATISGRLGSGSSATTKISRSSVTVESGTVGWLSYTPTSAEINEAGDYLCQIKLVDGGGDTSFLERFILEVEEVIDLSS